MNKPADSVTSICPLLALLSARVLLHGEMHSRVHLDHGEPMQCHLNIHIMLEFDVLNFPKTFSVTHVTPWRPFASVLVPGKLNMLWHRKVSFPSLTEKMQIGIRSSPPRSFGWSSNPVRRYLVSLRWELCFLFLPDSTSFWRRWGQIPLKLFVAPFQLYFTSTRVMCPSLTWSYQ